MSGIPNAATAATWGDRPPARRNRRDPGQAEPIQSAGQGHGNESSPGTDPVFALLEASRPFGA
jgi:hypothetical protein